MLNLLYPCLGPGAHVGPCGALVTSCAARSESVDGVRRCTELGVLHGQQRRTRELLTLLRRRRLLRREEVLALICGRPPPPAATHSRHRYTLRRAQVQGGDRSE